MGFEDRNRQQAVRSSQGRRVSSAKNKKLKKDTKN